MHSYIEVTGCHERCWLAHQEWYSTFHLELSHSHRHTLTHLWHSHWEWFWVQNLAQGHFSMKTGGGGDQPTSLLIRGRYTALLEPQPLQKPKLKIKKQTTSVLKAKKIDTSKNASFSSHFSTRHGWGTKRRQSPVREARPQLRLLF